MPKREDETEAVAGGATRKRLYAAVALAAFVALTLGSVFLPGLFGIKGADDITAILGDLRGTSWAPVAVVIVFVVLGLIGVPQFAMILGAALLLGPWLGIAASWVGTMISATIGFYLGKRFGASLVRRYGGRRVNSLSEAMGHHGILATALLRNLPAGPFIFVNMVAGLSHMSLAKYVIGTALGSLPKMLAVSFLGVSFFQLILEGEPIHLLIAAGVGIAWLAFMYVLRRWWMRRSAALREIAAAAAPEREGGPPAETPAKGDFVQEIARTESVQQDAAPDAADDADLPNVR